MVDNRTGRNPYKEEAIVAANELRYGPKVVNQIKKAKTDDEISRIMMNARRKKIDETEKYGGNW